MASSQKFTVTGPDLDVTAANAVLGLSRAITAGNAAAHASRDATYYVRNPSGDLVGRVEAHGSDRSVDIRGSEFFRTGGRAQDAPTVPLPQPRRPAVGHHDSTTNNGKEPDMAPSATEVQPDPKEKTHTRGPKKTVGDPDAAAKASAEHTGVAKAKDAPKGKAAPKAKAESAAKSSTAAKSTASKASTGTASEKPKKVPAKQAAVDVLKKADGPLHISKIVEGVLATPGVKLGGKTPNATIAAMFAVESKKSDGLFVKTEKATYALRDA